MKKKGIVENDKAKIEQVIAELDEKKNEALKKAFERVNIVSCGSHWSLHFEIWQVKFRILIPSHLMIVLRNIRDKD